MDNFQKEPEFKKRLSGQSVAKLLGLSEDEFTRLKHGPFQMRQDAKGIIIDFFMRIDTGNDSSLMKKLKVDKQNYVHFKPAVVYAFYEAL